VCVQGTLRTRVFEVHDCCTCILRLPYDFVAIDAHSGGIPRTLAASLCAGEHQKLNLCVLSLMQRAVHFGDSDGQHALPFAANSTTRLRGCACCTPCSLAFRTFLCNCLLRLMLLNSVRVWGCVRGDRSSAALLTLCRARVRAHVSRSAEPVVQLALRGSAGPRGGRRVPALRRGLVGRIGLLW
jgi:hypothetical protein